MGKIVGVRFREGGKTYHFDSGHFVLSVGDRVIVKTAQGLGLGQVVTPSKPVEASDENAIKKIYRLANEDDLWQHDKNVAREKFAFYFCLERIKARRMAMKLVTTEALFDGSKIIFYYTADGRVDFRSLVKDLVAKFRTRIEMRQIGVRHEAKMVGGLGCCGREFCCAGFLNEFAPVSVKMAKEQNLSLNPAKISGVCGRLMCCLTYEYETYLYKKKGLPKLGKRFMTKSGEGKVIRQNIMLRVSTVLLPDGTEVEVCHDEDNPGRDGHDGHGSGRAKEKNE
ncbi:MAG: stage 0 sporulation family protein [Thermodesulfobacteriota bacterium]|nr:stage 0 sporulation family protein [Thermodesulfobacteriota bacterium]